MENPPTTDPVALLRKMEADCRNACGGLQHKPQPGSEWSGIAFRVADTSLVTPLGEVAEILEYPPLTPVPMTRPWVRGIANIRGRLLPVIDFGAFLGRRPARTTARTRVLVVDYNEVYTGLVVDEVAGMKHFMNSEYVSPPAAVEACMQPYMHNGFCRGEQYWGLFSLHRLVESAEFLQAAA